MNYVPINGLRLLAIETGILVGLTCVAFFFLRFVKRQYCLPGWVAWILAEDWRAVLLVVALALVGRALVLPWVGVPQPRINDEYSYLLMGDTFAHFRLTNPTPAVWPHFETFHVNLTPTYHSKYPVAQGLFLAFGEVVFHQPWVGIYLSTALMCGAICWALQAFLPPGWALIGGLLVVARFGIFSYWVNSYWGGSVAALGGALALGAVTRAVRRPANREQTNLAFVDFRGCPSVAGELKTLRRICVCLASVPVLPLPLIPEALSRCIERGVGGSPGGFDWRCRTEPDGLLQPANDRSSAVDAVCSE